MAGVKLQLSRFSSIACVEVNVVIVVWIRGLRSRVSAIGYVARESWGSMGIKCRWRVRCLSRCQIRRGGDRLVVLVGVFLI